MNISQFCRELNLHAATIQKHIADQRVTSKANISMKEELTPAQQRDLAKAYPNHVKTIKIICDEDESFTVQYLGDWDGRLVKAANRAYAGSFKKDRKVLQKPDRPEGFTSYPTREEIRAEKTARANRHLEELKSKGRLDEDGNIISDYDFAQKAEGASLPLPTGPTSFELEKVKSIPPEIPALDNTVVDLVTEMPEKAIPQSTVNFGNTGDVKVICKDTTLTNEQGNE